jgi:hypothetical protein
MPANLDSLEQLTAWETYCAFMKERLVQLPKGECPFYLSKKKLEFTDNGKSWKGHAVLVGPKGELVVKAVGKEGVQFLEGICTADGKQFTVSGIDASLLKLAASTLKRTKLGFKISGAEGSEDADGATEDGGAPGGRRRAVDRFGSNGGRGHHDQSRTAREAVAAARSRHL